LIGLDTNVLVRHITQDDPKQSPAANKLIEGLSPQRRGFVSLVALAEVCRGLREAYDVERDHLAAVVEQLLQRSTLVVESAETVWRSVARYRQGAADFADLLIERVGNARGCSETVTFDRVAARDAGMRLIGRGE
jgi:predicted nucleic-acid-binding protein